MDPRFQSFIEAVIHLAKAEESLLWADEVAERIASSTPLSVRKSDISAQITREAARMGVPVTVAAGRTRPAQACCA